MTIQDYLVSKPGSLPVNGFQILGTDISPSVLTEARSASYEEVTLSRGLSEERRNRYFRRKGKAWELIEDIRKRVTFREFNLMQSYALLGRFDVIYCRNVLIYFDQPTKTRVLEGISRLLPPDGVLYLGGAETVLGVSDRFQPIPGLRGIYCLAESAEEMRKLAG